MRKTVQNADQSARPTTAARRSLRDLANSIIQLAQTKVVQRRLEVESVAQSAAILRQKLLNWYDAHRRDLPWRGTGDPYRVWLSEMMLQQTQVVTVIPYFERFVALWPTVADLAAAPLDDVLRGWAGLGYYARARNLHKAARMVVDEFDGMFPTTVENLLCLPGVGRYSAGAIASIAFNIPAPVVDGNVSRVLARWFDLHDDVRAGPGRDRVWDMATVLVPQNRPGDFNQALMELGATVCLPGEAARCLTCPMRAECAAAANGTAAELPVKTKRATVREETHVVVAIERAGRWLVVRRPEAGLWGGLWAMPSAPLKGESRKSKAKSRKGGDAKRRNVETSKRQKGGMEWLSIGEDGAAPECAEGEAAIASDAAFTGGSLSEAVRGVARDVGVRGGRVESAAFCDFTHVLTHRRIRFVGHVLRWCSQMAEADTGDRRWLTLDEIEQAGVSKAMRRVVEALRASGHAGITGEVGCPANNR